VKAYQASSNNGAIPSNRGCDCRSGGARARTPAGWLKWRLRNRYARPRQVIRTAELRLAAATHAGRENVACCRTAGEKIVEFGVP